MKFAKIFVCTFIMTFSFLVNGAEGMKPGLWEADFNVKTQSGKVEKAMADVKKQMASLPADQRKMMEDMMASQGVSYGTQSNTFKVCISPEQAAKLEIPQQDKNCNQEVLKRTATSVKMKVVCTGQYPTSGEGEFNLTSPTTYTANISSEMTVDGKKDHMDVDQKGKWVSADCGKIKSLPVRK